MAITMRSARRGHRTVYGWDPDMTTDERLLAARFPRASKYHPDWVLAGASGGANPLWLTEWLLRE
jgi:hypothetical protein